MRADGYDPHGGQDFLAALRHFDLRKRATEIAIEREVAAMFGVSREEMNRGEVRTWTDYARFCQGWSIGDDRSAFIANEALVRITPAPRDYQDAIREQDERP